MTINNEAILLSMIENAYLKRKNDRIYIDSGEYWVLDDDVSIIGDAELFLILQRALFEECHKRDIVITIKNSKLIIKMNFMDSQFAIMDFMDSQLIILDTSRESFALAYQKVVGINGN